ncbi:MAG: MarR family transcriptional regulator [Paludibacteraceae bacterium]|nr:MarR family transcriptional regulator [Paludibacteraceae bacterium]MBN2788432.1 MarR family transcriptional regulator [Paludibacteraceae bacterium]
METYEQLKLDNQLCFPFYAISRLITRQYQPYLDELGITYPQYLVLLVLWENDNLTVNQIANRLILNTNTITPLLKRMESMKLLTRKKDKTDERRVMVQLTPMGSSLREKAKCIPSKLIESDETNERQLEMMKKFQQQLLTFLNAMRDAADS